MRVFKEKFCILCSSVFTPSSPKQKFCVYCKNKAKQVAQAERDKKRNRKKHNVLYTKTCEFCNTNFETFYSKKNYCGSKECDAKRKKRNSLSIEKRRSLQRSILRKLNKYKKQGKILKYIKKYIHSKNYILLEAKKYKNSHHSILKLKCPEGHIWESTFHNFKDNHNRCAFCYHQNNYISKPEQSIRTFIQENFPTLAVIYNDRLTIPPKELDLYFPDKNLAVEICGLYWHGEVSSGKPKDYHYAKMMACYDKGIRLITIFEDELLNFKEVVFSRIRQALGEPSIRIFARKCIIKEIDSKTANSFYIKNHVQGASTALIRYGLFHENMLVCVGSLGNITRKHTADDFTLELKRFCTLPNISVVGGVSKIFKQMIKYSLDNDIKEIRSYCDMRYANIFKPVYEVLGFTLLTYTKYTPHYFKGQKRYRNISLRKTAEERLTGLTEWELRKSQGYDRIWDCGHRTYVYKL